MLPFCRVGLSPESKRVAESGSFSSSRVFENEHDYPAEREGRYLRTLLMKGPKFIARRPSLP